MDTTYDPKEKTKYFVRQWDVEDWIEEQYDVPFSIPADLEEMGSPDGDYTVSVTGKVGDYKKESLAAFFEDAKGKDHPPNTRLLTEPLMNKLASDGHIPKGEYVISLSY